MGPCLCRSLRKRRHRRAPLRRCIHWQVMGYWLCCCMGESRETIHPKSMSGLASMSSCNLWQLSTLTACV